jgi:hypothetical protein
MSEADLAQLRRDIGNRLKTAFETESYSEIGRQLSIPSVANTKVYVDGDRFPSTEVLIRFRARGFSVEWLLTGEGSRWAKPAALFSAEDEKKIQAMANAASRSFWEQVVRMTKAGLAFNEELESWKP